VPTPPATLPPFKTSALLPSLFLTIFTLATHSLLRQIPFLLLLPFVLSFIVSLWYHFCLPSYFFPLCYSFQRPYISLPCFLSSSLFRSMTGDTNPIKQEDGVSDIPHEVCCPERLGENRCSSTQQWSFHFVQRGVKADTRSMQVTLLL
jgi:hypothetical protein